MATKALTRQGGRKKKVRSRPMDGSRKSALLVGMPKHRARAVIREAAYLLGVPADAAWISHAITVTHRVKDLLGERETRQTHGARMSDKELRQRTAAILAEPRPKTGLQKYYLQLKGQRELSYSTLLDIEYAVGKVRALHDSVFWEILAAQPTGLAHYNYWARHLSFSKTPLGPSPWDTRRDVAIRPPLKAISATAKHGTLRSLAFLMIAMGAAYECNWPDIYKESFHWLSRKLWLYSAVQPFADFGPEFAGDVLASAVRGKWPIPSDWRAMTQRVVPIYKRAILAAYANGDLVRDETYPRGNRQAEIDLLTKLQARYSLEKIRASSELKLRNAKGRPAPAPPITVNWDTWNHQQLVSFY